MQDAKAAKTARIANLSSKFKDIKFITGANGQPAVDCTANGGQLHLVNGKLWFAPCESYKTAVADLGNVVVQLEEQKNTATTDLQTELVSIGFDRVGASQAAATALSNANESFGSSQNIKYIIIGCLVIVVIIIVYLKFIRKK